MGRKVAVVGIGQQKIQRRKEETIDEMVFEVAKKALEDAGLHAEDVQAVVFGCAVDAFCGIHNSDKLVIGASGGVLKPTMRNSTSGSTAVSTPILGYTHVASGLFDIVMVVCYEKMSENVAPQGVFNTVYDPVFVRPIGLNVPIQCALEARAYMARYGITEEQMAKISVKNHRNATRNPYAQLPMELTVEDVMNSPYLAWPIKRLDTSPTSDGACAMILAAEGPARELKDVPVWVKGVGRGADSVWFMSRRNIDLARLDYAYLAAKQAYEMAGIKNPREEIDVAEVYDPFTFKEMQHCEALGLCEEGGAGRMIDEGISEFDGALPVNPSGGLLGEGNPIGAGMNRACWAVRQVRGDAGDCQVRNVRTAVANAWGGMYQYNAVMVFGRDD
jgi:acetyl-CoA C-acetyltransferase